MAVSISEKPNRNVSSIGAPARDKNGSYKMTVKWKASDYLHDDNNKGRCEGWEIRWNFRVYDTKKKAYKTLTRSVKGHTPRARDHSIYISGFECTDGKTYRRDTDFYPNGNLLLISVTVQVRPWNSKGTGSWASSTREFTKPRNPSVTIEQEADTGDVKYTIKHNPGEDYREIWDTYLTMTVYESSRGKVTDTATKTPRNTTETSTWNVDAVRRMLQGYSQYIRIRVRAYSRGIRGKSDVVTKDYYVSWPKVTTITGVDCSSKATTGKVTVKIDTNYHPKTNKGIHNPVTGIVLEKLVNVEYKEASEIPGDADWEATESVDDGNCEALSSTVALLQPEAGNTSWVRVKSWNDIEGIFFRYSAPVRLTDLERPAPTAADDEVVLGEPLSGDDGKSAVLTIGWADDDSTGTQVAWSDSEYAWRSTSEPDTFDFTWDDGSGTIGTETYDHTARLYVGDLTEGTRYYFRARRYLENDDGTEYGPWCPSDTTVSVVPTTSPESVTLNAVPFVPRGSSLPLSWTFDSEAEQTMWEVLTGPTITTTETVTQIIDGEPVEEEVEHLWIDETQAKVVASGTDASGSTVLTAERLAGIIGTDQSVPLAVRVRTGGDPVTSEAVTVEVADRPTVDATVVDEQSQPTETLTKQPFRLYLECSVAASVTVVATAAGGNSRERPTGIEFQPEGDAVCSFEVVPEWDEVTEGGEVVGYEATVTATSGLELWDRGEYAVTVTATDTRTGLVSDEVTAPFSVDYEHEPPTPTNAITVTPSDVTDADGIRTLSAIIQLDATTGMAQTDVYDVYRLTPDGAYLIASDLAQDETVTDPFAPFGNYGTRAYRVAIRTADGSESWFDYEYSLRAWMVRIDYGTEYVELPYNIQLGDQWEHDFEARRHMDGTINGYWNPGAGRVANISTDLVKRGDPEQVARVRALANHCGPCLVRTPDGCCYQADVTPNTLSMTYNDGAIPLSLNATEVELTEEYMATIPANEDEEEEEP